MLTLNDTGPASQKTMRFHSDESANEVLRNGHCLVQEF
jgi:hypothetical protein